MSSVMNLIEITIFLVLCCWSCETNLSKSTECKTCQPRNYFEHSFAACTCPLQQFCDESTQECKNCGNCFDFWNNATETAQSEMESSLERLIKRYQMFFKEIKYLLTILTQKMNKEESELNKSIYLSEKINKNILSISNVVKDLKVMLKKIEDALNNITLPTFLNTILMIFRNFNDKVEQLWKKLETIEVNEADSKQLLPQLIEKLKKIGKNIDISFPEMEISYLNLALETEKSLDLLEFSFNQTKTISEVDKKFIMNNIQWIENSLIDTIEAINRFRFSSLNDVTLTTNASYVRSSAATTRSKLKKLLQDHEHFKELHRQLKMENDHYREIKKLQEKLNAISKFVGNLDSLINTWKGLMKLNKELENYQLEFMNFKKKVDTLGKYLQKMRDLLKEEKISINNFNEIKNVRTINQLKNKIKDLVDDNKIIACEIIYHCNEEQKNKCN